ncbi:MAG: hypothetical protein PHV34_08485 [Verrucomicrobiae bacterium]|nr:hypothetical protein [Verrucomicrobiae bacterium]
MKIFNPMFFQRFAAALLCGVAFLFSSCAQSSKTAASDHPTRQLVDNAVRYGAIGTAGTAGFFAGKELGGDNAAGAVGAAVGAGGLYALEKFTDRKQRDEYERGIAAGAAQARAEQLEERWTREARYGLPPDGASAPPQFKYRRVYVPSRVINGVKMEGQYQTVVVSP